jgi:hypothetical protein
MDPLFDGAAKVIFGGATFAQLGKLIAGVEPALPSGSVLSLALATDRNPEGTFDGTATVTLQGVTEPQVNALANALRPVLPPELIQEIDFSEKREAAAEAKPGT